MEFGTRLARRGAAKLRSLPRRERPTRATGRPQPARHEEIGTEAVAALLAVCCQRTVAVLLRVLEEAVGILGNTVLAHFEVQVRPG